MSAGGRSATFESERERLDHRRAQNDPQLAADVFKSSPSTKDNRKGIGGGALARVGLPLTTPANHLPSAPAGR